MGYAYARDDAFGKKKGIWTFEKRSGRRRSRVYLRCAKCGRINDFSPTGVCVVYHRGVAPEGQIDSCWACRHCGLSLTGSVFGGWGLAYNADKNPFGTVLEDFDRLLDGTGFSVRGPARYGYDRARWRLHIGHPTLSIQMSVYRESRRGPYTLEAVGGIELKTPLEVILGIIQFALEKTVPEAARPMVQAIREKVKKNAQAPVSRPCSPGVQVMKGGSMQKFKPEEAQR